MSWELATATGHYVVDLAPDGAGPVLQDWTSGAVRDWSPSLVEAFETPVDRLPLEYAALGSRHVRGCDLIVVRPDQTVGARLTWAAADVVMDTRPDGGTLFTARAVDELGELEVVLRIETSPRARRGAQASHPDQHRRPDPDLAARVGSRLGVAGGTG